LKTPPSFSVVFRVYGDKIWIEQAGGCTATALLGRFSLFSEKVLEEARYITSVEEKLNEDVVFAEISCFNDEHAANINSNAGIRTYEIPIGVHSIFKEDNIINLCDLTLSIIENQIVLRSKKLNKIVIPRLSSAFNYSRSDLTIFRFLCDLQYQGLKFNFNFDLRSLLPGLNYYPRVEYKKCILYPSTWILNAQEIIELTEAGSSKSIFYKMCSKYKLTKYFALTEGDNQLLFNREDPESIELFVKAIKNKTLVVLQEVFIGQSSPVINSAGQPYVSQFIASVFTDGATYPQRTQAQVNRKKNKIKRIYLPGDEWVYFKLYCHPAISNNILIKDVKNIISRLKKQNIVKSWFFIRYTDPDDHLRIRIKINPDDAAKVVSYFEKKMRSQVERGCVNNMVLDTYKREIERYGEDTIEYAEKIFYSGSELVVNYLKNIAAKPADFSELHLAIVSVDALLEVFFSGNSDRINLLKLMHEGMKHEFDDSKQVKLQLDNKYREYSGFFNNMARSKPSIILLAGKKEFDNYIKDLTLLKSNAQAVLPVKLMSLAADLIHMHLNRLFNDKQRNHEFIIYYLLYKYYLSTEARKGKGLLSFSPTFKGSGTNHINESVFK
jgi:thiopeptide-type bacteriocin biosynthesis protein